MAISTFPASSGGGGGGGANDLVRLNIIAGVAANYVTSLPAGKYKITLNGVANADVKGTVRGFSSTNAKLFDQLLTVTPYYSYITFEANETIEYLNISADQNATAIVEAGSSTITNTPDVTIITTGQDVTLTQTSEVVIIGGGGGGGGAYTSTNAQRTPAGGGSGYITKVTLPAGVYTAVIGAGGAGGTNSGVAGSGGTTSFGSDSAAGGGGGEGYSSGYTYPIGGNGGSGGTSGGYSTKYLGGIDGSDGAGVNGFTGVGSGEALPWWLPLEAGGGRVVVTTKAGEGGALYGGGSNGTIDAANGLAGRPGTSFGGGGGGAAVDSNNTNAHVGGGGFQGAVFILNGVTSA